MQAEKHSRLNEMGAFGKLRMSPQRGENMHAAAAKNGTYKAQRLRTQSESADRELAKSRWLDDEMNK